MPIYSARCEVSGGCPLDLNHPAPAVTLMEIAEGDSFHDPLPLRACH
jgi:hypothetical protein